MARKIIPSKRIKYISDDDETEVNEPLPLYRKIADEVPKKPSKRSLKDVL